METDILAEFESIELRKTTHAAVRVWPVGCVVWIDTDHDGHVSASGLVVDRGGHY